MHKPGLISIWFFIGSLMLVYGALIFGVSVYQYFSPPQQRPVLAELHSGIWWGLFMIVLGVVYTRKFAPRGEK